MSLTVLTAVSSPIENSISQMYPTYYMWQFFLEFSLLGTEADHPLEEHKFDTFLTSEEWLQKYGLKAQKLTVYDALADCTFRHADGIVGIKTKPEDESSQTDAVSSIDFSLTTCELLIFCFKTWNVWIYDKMYDLLLWVFLFVCFIFLAKVSLLVEWDKDGHKLFQRSIWKWFFLVHKQAARKNKSWLEQCLG